MKLTRRALLELSSAAVIGALAGCDRGSQKAVGGLGLKGTAFPPPGKQKLYIDFHGLNMFIPGKQGSDDLLHAALVDAQHNKLLGLDEHFPTLVVPRSWVQKGSARPSVVTPDFALWGLSGQVTLSGLNDAGTPKLQTNRDSLKPKGDGCPDISSNDRRNFNSMSWLGKLTELDESKKMTLKADWSPVAKAYVTLSQGFVGHPGDKQLGEAVHASVYTWDPLPATVPSNRQVMALKEVVRYIATFEDTATFVFANGEKVLIKSDGTIDTVRCSVVNIPAIAMLPPPTRLDHFKAFYEFFDNAPAPDARPIPVKVSACGAIDASTGCPGGEP